jgi:hypothetical protein
VRTQATAEARENDGAEVPDDARTAQIARGILAVREGHGANCSSIGSVVDTLFAAAVVGGAVFAAIAAALAREDVRIAGATPGSGPDGPREPPKSPIPPPDTKRSIPPPGDAT